METGLGGPDRDTESFGHFGEWQPDVVVEDEHGALLEGEPPEGALEFVVVVDGHVLARLGRLLDGQDADVDRPATATPGLGVALVGQDPMEPRFEAIGITERPNLAPGGDERCLHRVLGLIGVPKDPTRDRHASVADHAGEGVEGLRVALLRAIHERSVHPLLLP
jgi:hypothetical protein